MHTVKYFLLTLLSLAAIVACNREDLYPDAGSRPISIEAGIGVMSKVAVSGNSTNFETGDAISLYAWTGSSSAVPATRVVDGVKNTLAADGSWTPASPMLWADNVSPHFFLGIYPFRNVTDFKADAFTLDPADSASDLLVATRLEGIKATDKPVALTFDHAMARLDVNLTFRTQWASAPTVSSVKATAKTTATVDYLSKTKLVSATGTATSVALTARNNAAWTGLQVPQEGVRTLTIRIDDKDYVFTHSADIPLAGGKYTTVNLNVGRDKIELASDIMISNWTAGTTISGGEAQDD